VEWLTVYLEEFTYIGIAVSLLLAGLGIPLPEDIPLIFGGVMAGAGKINLVVHFIISMTFIIIGDSCLYAIGRRLGSASAAGASIWSRLLPARRRAKVMTYFDKYGSWTVFLGRFLAGVRGAIYLSAGAAHFPYWRFILLDFLAALISVPIWIWLGYTFGANWHEVLKKAQSTESWILAVVALLVIGGIVAVKVRRRRRA